MVISSAGLILREARVFDPVKMRISKPVSIAIVGKRIAAIDRNDSHVLRDFAGSRTDIRSVEGDIVSPAFGDAHTHFVDFGLSEAAKDGIDLTGYVNLRSIDNQTDGLQTLQREWGRQTERQYLGAVDWKPTKWFPDGNWEQYHTRENLDRVTGERPAFVFSLCCHFMWLNSAALNVCGLMENPFVPGGEVVLDATGRPTGIIKENPAILKVVQAFPRLSQETIIRALHFAVDSMHRVGITSAVTFGPSGIGYLAPDEAMAYRSMLAMKELGIRIRFGVRYANEHEEIQRLWSDLPAESRDDCSIFGRKWTIDGSLGGQSAYMFDPYEQSAGTGVLVFSQAELNEQVTEAARLGLPASIHAIGDRAAAIALNAIAAARQVESVHLRHRVEHAQLLRDDEIRKMAELQVIASMQPCHLVGDVSNGEKYWGARSKGAFAFRSLLDRGVSLAFGSDAPIEDPNPMLGFYAAMARDRKPDDREGLCGGWHLEQRISLVQAMRAFTIGSAYSTSREQSEGRVLPGYLADLVVLPADFLSRSPREVLNTQIIATIQNGKVVYEKP